MEKIKIEKGTVQETLIVPLYGRKMCTENFPDLYRDEYAVELCKRIDYDFEEQDRQAHTFKYKYGAVVAAMRQIDMRWEIEDYLKTHPRAAIVNIGCGLDQTPLSCDNGSCRFYNVDFPDTIEIRKKLLGENDREVNIPTDINDHTWLDSIDASEGVIFFAAGVFHYFKTEEIKSLVLKMADKFPGGRLVFDTVGKTGRNLMMKKVLKNMNMKEVKGYFYVNNVQKQLGDWSDRISLSHKGYMLGYNNMKAEGIKPTYRMLARFGDKIMKMQIIRMDFKEKA